MTARLLALSLSMLLSARLAAGAPLAPVGPEFQANSYTTGYQFYPAAAVDASGNFVVVWQGTGIGGDAEIRGQRYDLGGVPLGGEIAVNFNTTGEQRAPVVAMDGSGNFAVAWASDSGGGSDPGDVILAQRFDFAFATPYGFPEFQVNTYTTSTQSLPALVGRPAGGFFVVWTSNGSAGDDSSDTSVQGRLYDGSFSPGGEFQVNTYTTGLQVYPAVAANAAGDFVVVWESGGSAGTDTDQTGIQGRRFSSTGAPQGSQFQVNTYTTGFQVNPAVAFDTNGNFVVVWTNGNAGGVGSDTSVSSISARRYDATGTPLGGEFQVNSFTTNYQGYPRVAGGALGTFLVTWQSEAGGSTDPNLVVKGQQFGSAGTPVGPEFQVNTYTPDNQERPAVSSNAAGTFVVAWSSYGSAGSDSSYRSVQAQRFGPGLTIRGKKIVVRDPTSIETRRSILALGKEAPTDLSTSIGGAPEFTGATLRVILKGTTNSNQAYSLGAGGWTFVSGGYKYTGPTLGDPVRKVIIKRTPGGLALLKALIKGSIGTQDVDAVPPNTGTEGGIVLTIPGDASYCTTFGGTAGGVETNDDAQLWKVIDATAEDCPLP